MKKRCCRGKKDFPIKAADPYEEQHAVIPEEAALETIDFDNLFELPTNCNPDRFLKLCGIVKEDEVFPYLRKKGLCFKDKGYNNYASYIRFNGKRKCIYLIRFMVSVYISIKKQEISRLDGADFDWSSYGVAAYNVPFEESSSWGEKLERLWNQLSELMVTISDRMNQGYEAMINESDSEMQPHDMAEHSDSDDITDDDSNAKKRKQKLSKSSLFADDREEVVKMFFENPLLGMGIDPELAAFRHEEHYKALNDDMTLSSRIHLMLEKMEKRKKTTSRTYIRTSNLYLLWLYANHPERYDTERVLKIEPTSVRVFFDKYARGEIRAYGNEPSIISVLSGARPPFREFDTSDGQLRASSLKRILSAIQYFQHLQDEFLIEKSPEALRENKDLSRMEEFYISKTSSHLLHARVDRQHNNFAANFDIDDKAKQAEEAMWQQSSVGWRTRALILTNTFSLSRQNETRKWELADMWEFCYKSSSSTVGSIDIRVLYFMQFAHKTAKSDTPPSNKVVVRHKEISLCPMGSIALMMWERFIVHREPFPNLLGPRENWYHVKIFRASSSPISELAASTTYKDQKKIIKKSSNNVRSAICHDSRKAGCLYARVQDIDLQELECLGLWRHDVLSSHYSHVFTADSCAKLGGYKSCNEYNLARSRANPFEMEIFKEDPFFSRFMRDLDNDQLESVLINDHASGKHYTGYNVYKALKLLKLVFYQDIPFIFRKWPELQIFKETFFTNHWSTFIKWCSCQYENERPTLSRSLIPTSHATFLDTSTHAFGGLNAILLAQSTLISQLQSQMDNLISHQRTVQRNVDEIREVVKGNSVISQLNKNNNEGDAKVTKKYEINALPKLNDMTLKQIYVEWHKGSSGPEGKLKALKKLEKKRMKGGDVYRRPGLKSTIRRRRLLVSYIDEMAKDLGSVKKAIKHINNERITMGGESGKAVSLNALAESLDHRGRNANTKGPLITSEEAKSQSANDDSKQ